MLASLKYWGCENLKAKKIYLNEQMIKKIQEEIDITGQSFTDYVRNALTHYQDKPAVLPCDDMAAHTEQLALLTNVLHQYILTLAEKDLYGDCLPDLLEIQRQIQQLIDTETELMKTILDMKGG